MDLEVSGSTALCNVALLDTTNLVDFILQRSGSCLSSEPQVISGQGWDTLLCTNHVMSCMPGARHTSLGEMRTE